MRLSEEEHRILNDLWETAVVVLMNHAGLNRTDAQNMASVYTTAVGNKLITVRSVIRILMRLTQSGVEHYEPPMSIADLVNLTDDTKKALTRNE